MLKTKKEDFAYDRLPYPSMTFPQTHPGHLAAIGKFYGLEIASPEKCRVLELGCGDGTNLNWLAYSLPESEFVGIDLAKTHIDEAQETVAELNLDNIDFHQKDVLEISEETFGKFDYIIAHGLFSWVPDFVREKILSIYDELLNPNGVGYLSYNVLPGCHRRKIIGDAIRFHTRKVSDPTEKVKEAIPFAKFLTENAGDSELYKNILENELEGMTDRGESNIFHDDLSDENQAFYFSEFIELAEKHNLQYLSEVEKFTSQPRDLPPEVIGVLDNFSENIVEFEQYIDIFSSCRFRQTLLCKKQHKLERSFDPEKIKQFYISSNLIPRSENIDIVSQKAESFVSQNGASVEINYPLMKAVLSCLAKNGTHQMKFEDLIKDSILKLENNGYTSNNWTQEIDTTASLLFQIHSLNSIRFHLNESKAVNKISEFPKASDFARLQAKRNQNVTTFHGLNLTVDDEFMKTLISLTDGTRDLDEIISKMITTLYPEIQNPDSPEIKEEFSGQVLQALNQIKRFGLLVS